MKDTLYICNSTYELTKDHDTIKCVQPDPENEEQIAALRLIALRLSRLYQPKTAMKWLLGVNAFLGNRRPTDLIRRGRIAEVLAAIEQTATNSYA